MTDNNNNCTDLVYTDLDPGDDPDICTHPVLMWISKGRRTFAGEVDDNIVCLHICANCGAVIERE